jgi:hypothetical protein
MMPVNSGNTNSAIDHEYRILACDITSHYEGFFVKAQIHLIPPRPPATGGMRLTRRGSGGGAPGSGRTRPEDSRTAHWAVDGFVAADSDPFRSTIAIGPARGVRGQTTIRVRGPIHPVRSHSTLQQPGCLIPTGGVTRPIGFDPD